MCLLSITENGLIPKDYRSLKTQYLQSYGPEHLLTFSNLRRAGLLTEQAPGDTLTAVESKVSKLVTDKAAGEQETQVTPSALLGHCSLFFQQTGVSCCGTVETKEFLLVTMRLWV